MTKIQIKEYKAFIKNLYAKRNFTVLKIRYRANKLKDPLPQFDVYFKEGTGPLGLSCVTMNLSTIIKEQVNDKI